MDGDEDAKCAGWETAIIVYIGDCGVHWSCVYSGGVDPAWCEFCEVEGELYVLRIPLNVSSSIGCVEFEGTACWSHFCELLNQDESRIPADFQAMAICKSTSGI
jgi:hypothetical protein